MSGGRFEYNQYKIGYIADEIQAELDNMGKEIPENELMASPDWYKQYPEDKFYTTYPDEIVKEFKNAIRYLRIAKIYAHRVDWFFSGDDGEEDFTKRLKEDLDEFNKTQKDD
jgi:hypothetical protein